MRRKLIGVLVLSVMLLFSFTSCSLDGILDATQGNKFGQNGSSESIKSLANTIAKTPTTEVDGESVITENEEEGKSNLDISKVSGFESLADAVNDFINPDAEEGSGLVLVIDSNVADRIAEGGLIAPLEDKAEFNKNINDALSSSGKEETFVNEMKKGVSQDVATAAQNTMALTNSLLSEVVSNLEDSDDALYNELKSTLTNLQKQLESKSDPDNVGSITSADVLQVQMVSNLVTSVSSVIPEEGKEIQLNNPAITDALSEIRLISKTSSTLRSGGINALNLGNLADLVQSFVDQASAEETTN